MSRDEWPAVHGLSCADHANVAVGEVMRPGHVNMAKQDDEAIEMPPLIDRSMHPESVKHTPHSRQAVSFSFVARGREPGQGCGRVGGVEG